MRPHPIRIEREVGVARKPLGTVSRVNERDGVDGAVAVLVEVREVHQGIDEVQRIRDQVPGQTRQTRGAIGVIGLRLGQVDPTDDGRVDRQVAVGVLQIVIANTSSRGQDGITTDRIHDLVEISNAGQRPILARRPMVRETHEDREVLERTGRGGPGGGTRRRRTRGIVRLQQRVQHRSRDSRGPLHETLDRKRVPRAIRTHREDTALEGPRRRRGERDPQ